MARIRTVKPEFWQDEKLAPLRPIDRLVFLGLISQADDAGRLVDSVRLLDGLLFPQTTDSCADSLEILAGLGVIERGRTASGQPIIQITGWKQHQRIDKPNLRQALPPIAPTQRQHTPEPVAAVGFAEPSTKRPRIIRDESSNHTYDLRPTIGEQGPTIDDHGPTTAEASRAHTSEPAREAAAPAPTDDVGVHQNAMQRLVEQRAARLDGIERRKFTAAAGVLVSGADSSCWRNPRTGHQVPWAERPRLLEVAIAKLAAGERNTIRAALTLAIQQQIDPFPVTTSPVAAGSAAAQVLASGQELPQSTATRTGRMERSDGYSREQAELEEQRRLDHAVRQWEQDNPEQAHRLMLQAKAWADSEFPGNPARGVMAPIEYRKRVVALLETTDQAAGAAVDHGE